MRPEFKVSQTALSDTISVSCNICGSVKSHIRSTVDRYGLPVNSVICKECGLIYLNPMMTQNAYWRFYASGEYRKLLNAFKKPVTPDESYSQSVDFGIRIAKVIGPFLHDGLTVEVGSSRGGILHGLKKAKDTIIPLGVEPSIEEAEYAIAKGIPTQKTIIEELSDSVNDVKNILSVRSLNHMVDPTRFLDYTKKHLSDDGRLFIIVLDFMKFCLRNKAFISQIDHPYMFFPDTLRQLVEKCGFKINLCEVRGAYIYLYAQRACESKIRVRKKTRSYALTRIFLSELALRPEFDTHRHFLGPQ